MSEALAQDSRRSACSDVVEPGGYWTDLYRSGMFSPSRSRPTGRCVPATAPRRRPSTVTEAGRGGHHQLVDSEEPPLRLILGSAVLDAVIAVTKQRIATWERWEEVSRAAEHAIPMPEG